MTNPMVRDKIYTYEEMANLPMTLSGVVNKTLFLFVMLIVSSLYAWSLVAQGFMDKVNMLCMGGIITGLISAFMAGFKPKYSMPLGIIYALSEGLVLGTISAMYETVLDGIVLQAILATVITAFVMLLFYRTGIIKPTKRFVSVITTATFSIFIFYLLMVALSFFPGLAFGAMLANAYNNIFIIGVIIAVAALNLIIDFDYIVRMIQQNMPKYFEWYGGIVLLVTLVWLYLEMLHLLSRLRK